MTITRTFNLRRHLERIGAVTERGTSRAASRWACRTCGALVLRGLDGDVLAFDVTVDPTPLDPIGEVLALAAGRRTFDAVTTTGRIELEPRRACHIPTRRYPVLPEHRCGQQLPTTDTDDAQEVTTDEPPF